MIIIKMVNYIWITAQKEMLHRYPDAPEEVKFLRNEHRHIFHFKIYIEVKHDNRDVEFIKFKREVEGIINEWDRDKVHMSCEMMAYELRGVLSVRYPKRDMKIEISEDKENGVEYEYKS